MSRTARLFQLMQSLRAGAPPHTARNLAHDLGVSARTIHRDIDTLRSLGAVIDGAAGFGFTLIEDATLPPLGFNDEELEALVLGLREVQQVGDPDLAQAAKAALAKLQGRLPPRQAHRLTHSVLSAHRFSPPAPPTIPVAALRRATWEEMIVEFSYSDARNARTRRRVSPLGLSYMDRSTVMIAWCHLRQDFRTFRLDRMTDLRVTEESFRPKRVPLLRTAIASFKEEARLAEHCSPADTTLS
ncbi:YafY family transcriptional regulator [Rhodobacteraceae bacterium F11138]|nr:YafY family transcriptional regulator [Rhodobacteraceae bacterium F11138]